MGIKDSLYVELVFVSMFFILAAHVTFAENKPDLGPLALIPKLTETEKKDGPQLYDGSVNPYFGTTCMNFTYTVRYKDDEGRPPTYMKIWHDYKWYDMQKIQGDYVNGALYAFSYIPTSGKELFYYFEASNGAGKARSAIIDSPNQGPLLYSEKLDNNQIILLDKDGNKIWSYDTKNDWVEGVAISKDSKYIAAVTGYFIRLFSKDSNATIWSFCQICEVPEITMAPFNGIDISEDGSYIAGTLGNTLFFFSKDSNKPLWKYDIESNGIGVAISDDGNYIAVGTGNAGTKGDTIFVFNKKGELLWKYKAEHPDYIQTGNFYRPAMTPDGKFIGVSTGCPDRRAYLFSNTGDLLFRSEHLTRDSPLHKTSISNDGEFTAYSADQEQGKPNLFLFSKSGKLLWNFSYAEDSTSRAVSISSDGKYIASGTLNGKIYFFSRENNVPLWSFAESGNFAKIGDVKLSHDGSHLAAVSSSKKIYLFSKDSNKPLWTYTAPTHVTFADFNGEYVVAGTGVREYQFEGNSASKEIVICKEITNPKHIWEIKEATAISGIGNNNPPPTYCGNGICEPTAEDYTICPQDCCPPSGCTKQNNNNIANKDGTIIGGEKTNESSLITEELKKNDWIKSILDFFRNLFK